MKTGIIKLIFFSVLSLGISGCISMGTNATGIGQTALPYSGQKYEVVGKSKGQSSSYRLLWFFQVTPTEEMERAVKKAIAEKAGDNMINVCYWKETQIWLLGLGTVKILHVEGDVIRYKD